MFEMSAMLGPVVMLHHRKFKIFDVPRGAHTVQCVVADGEDRVCSGLVIGRTSGRARTTPSPIPSIAFPIEGPVILLLYA